MELLENPVLDRLAVAVLTFTVALVSLGASILCSYLWFMADLVKRLDYLSTVHYQFKRKRGRSRRRPCCHLEITVAFVGKPWERLVHSKSNISVLSNISSTDYNTIR